MFDELVVGVLINSSKTPLFTPAERVKMIEKVVGHVPNVQVMAFGGLLVDFVQQQKCGIIVRGLRVITDFEYELQLSHTNRIIAPDVDTVFLSTGLKYSYLSSSIVKEIAAYGGDISAFVREDIARAIKDRLTQKL